MFLTLTILEAVLIITGLVCVRRGGPVILYLLLFITIIDFINENVIVTHCMRWWHIPANVFYNIYSLFEMVCWLIIYYNIFRKRKNKRTVIILGSLVFIYSLLELFIINSFTVFHTSSFACFSLVSLFFSILYLFKVNSKPYHSLTGDPAFWICAAATCFNAVFLVNLFTMLDPDYWQHTDALSIFHLLQSIALIIYYLLLCIAFILFYYKHYKAITQDL